MQEFIEDGQNANLLVGKESPDGKGILEVKKGIEVGHIFQLGKLYSENMNATVLDETATFTILFMGIPSIGFQE